MDLKKVLTTAAITGTMFGLGGCETPPTTIPIVETQSLNNIIQLPTTLVSLDGTVSVAGSFTATHIFPAFSSPSEGTIITMEGKFSQVQTSEGNFENAPGDVWVKLTPKGIEELTIGFQVDSTVPEGVYPFGISPHAADFANSLKTLFEKNQES